MKSQSCSRTVGAVPKPMSSSNQIIGSRCARSINEGALPHTYRAVDIIWDHIGLDFLAKVFSGDPKYSNPVGALPSLHAAYPLLLLLLFWAAASPRVRVVLVAYVVAMAFVLVYFAEHYVFDLLAGYVYAVAALWIVGRILDRRTRLPAADSELPDG